MNPTRRSFFASALAAVAGLLWRPKAKAARPNRATKLLCAGGKVPLVIDNPSNSGRVIYLDSGDFLRPGEWFAVPFDHVRFLTYPV